jgi:hypothetical protein
VITNKNKVLFLLYIFWANSAIAVNKKQAIGLGFGNLYNTFDKEDSFKRSIGQHSKMKSSFYTEAKYLFTVKTCKFFSFKTGVTSLNIYLKTQKDPTIVIGETWPEHSIFQSIFLSSNQLVLYSGNKNFLTDVSIGLNAGKSILIRKKITNFQTNSKMTEPINYFLSPRDNKLLFFQLATSITVCQFFRNKLAFSINACKNLTPIYSGTNTNNNFFLWPQFTNQLLKPLSFCWPFIY